MYALERLRGPFIEASFFSISVGQQVLAVLTVRVCFPADTTRDLANPAGLGFHERDASCASCVASPVQHVVGRFSTLGFTYTDFKTTALLLLLWLCVCVVCSWLMDRAACLFFPIRGSSDASREFLRAAL